MFIRIIIIYSIISISSFGGASTTNASTPNRVPLKVHWNKIFKNIRFDKEERELLRYYQSSNYFQDQYDQKVAQMGAQTFKTMLIFEEQLVQKWFKLKREKYPLIELKLKDGKEALLHYIHTFDIKSAL